MAGLWHEGQLIGGSGGSSGHTILSSSTLPMAGMPNLQFGTDPDNGMRDSMKVENDIINNKTIVHGQVKECPTQEQWNLLSDAEKNDPDIYWYRPWASDTIYAYDRSPVGTVISVATGKTGDGITGVTTPTNPFPNKDYLICNGNWVYISEYPQLANHFAERYGNTHYFNNNVDPGNGKFLLPTWSTDDPENGILCIKARKAVDVVTMAEVDETGLSSRTDEVPSCARVAADEEILKSYTSSVGTWQGGELKFSIPRSNTVTYKLMVMGNLNNLGLVYFIIRGTDQNISSYSLGNATITLSYDYTNNILTATLPQTGYWVYSLVQIDSKH